MRAAIFAPVLVPLAGAAYPEGNWESGLVHNGMDVCANRNAANRNLYEARDPGTPDGRGGEYFQKTGGNWALQGGYSIRHCFRDTAPTSALATAFRKWNFGQKPEGGEDATNTAFHTMIKACQDDPSNIGWCRNGGGGESTFYAIAKETDDSLPQYYKDRVPDYVMRGESQGIPPQMKTVAEGHDGSSRRKPVWRDNGCEYPVMPGADLYMCGKKDNGIPLGVYKVPGDLVRTGSHTVCAAFEYFAHTQPGGEVLTSNPRKRVAVIPGRWDRAPMEWIINYGAPGPAQKALWWVHHKYKFWWGNQDQGHLSYIGSPLVQQCNDGAGGRRNTKDTCYRRQLMCSVYDSHNAWLKVYINGVLYGERNMNMYDHLTGVSNQWGNMMDIYEPDLYVGKKPAHQHSTSSTGRYTNVLGNADEKGHDFVGEFTMVGVWNNYLMTEAEAARMAGIQDAAVPPMTVTKTPVHCPTEFAQTPREATGITDAEQPRLTNADYASPLASTPVTVIPNTGKDGTECAAAEPVAAEPMADATIAGDPFTLRHGKKTQFFLPLDTDVPLVTCGGFEMRGRVIQSSARGDDSQWFKNISLLSGSDTLMTVEAVPPAAAGGARGGAAPATLRVVLAAKPVVQLPASGSAGGANVTAARDRRRPIGAGFSEVATVAAGALRFSVRSEAANKFASEADRLRNLHLDLTFDMDLERSGCTGTLPEIWGIQPLSAASAKFLEPAH